jgi:hypothetical protein
LLEFSLHEIGVGSRFYILLPKLNGTQLQALGTRLKSRGFTLSGGPSITARTKGFILHIGQSGLCWSTSDPADLVVPAIPELLATPKEAVPLEELARRYFFLKTSGSRATLRFNLRLERGSLWRTLRGTGQCGLAPDERAVLLFLLESSEGDCDVLTDFTTPTSRKQVIGGKLYFHSRLRSTVVGSTLSSVGMRLARNSYLPSGDMVHLTKFNPPSRRQLKEFFTSLGEWCYLKPA